MISASSPLFAVPSGILFFSVLLKILYFMQKRIPVCYRGSKDAVSRRHDVRVECHHAKWLTGFIDEDGKKKRREEQKAAQMRVEDRQNLDDPNRH